MKRCFEKVSYEQFAKDCRVSVPNLADVIIQGYYDQVQLPRRATKRSSGYDIHSPFTFALKPDETWKFPLGIKAYMHDDEELLFFPRSSIGFKYKIKLDNTIGKVDSDYVDNPDNEGHIFVSLTNTGDKTWEVRMGDRICQASFYKYLITDDDFPVSENRNGGLGSSGK